jgi:hypothetical protein
MNKQQKAEMINAAITRSSVAVDKQAKAAVVDGKIKYSYMRKGYRTTEVFVSFMDILCMLHGDDIRAIKNL